MHTSLITNSVLSMCAQSRFLLNLSSKFRHVLLAVSCLGLYQNKTLVTNWSETEMSQQWVWSVDWRTHWTIGTGLCRSVSLRGQEIESHGIEDLRVNDWARHSEMLYREPMSVSREVGSLEQGWDGWTLNGLVIGSPWSLHPMACYDRILYNGHLISNRHSFLTVL